MDIDFGGSRPQYCADNLTVRFLAWVDGRQVACAISVEALEDHFAVASTDEVGWLGAFEASREAIYRCARRLLALDAAPSVLLRSGHFHPAAPVALG